MGYDREDVSNIVALCGGVSAPAYVFVRSKKDKSGELTSYCIVVSDEIGARSIYYWDKDNSMPDTGRFGILYSGSCCYQTEKTAKEAVLKLHDFFRDRRVVCFDAKETYYPLLLLFEGAAGNEPRADIIDLKESARSIFLSKTDYSLSAVKGYLGMSAEKKDNVIDELIDMYDIFLKLNRLGMLEAKS